MDFFVLSRDAWLPDSGCDAIYLKIDFWNDYSFVTSFHVSLYDEVGQFYDIGSIKIGFKGQVAEVHTFTVLRERFACLGEGFFSLGTDVEYYRNIASLPNGYGKRVLWNLCDLVARPEVMEDIKNEPVFGISLLRFVSLSVVKGQFARVLDGKAELTDYKFNFTRFGVVNFGDISLDFNVSVGSMPSTNIHAVIGRNGVGKTTLLNSMISAITNRDCLDGKFYCKDGWEEIEIADDYFSSLVSVSFSAFDPFVPPGEQVDPSKGTCYFYIGLKDYQSAGMHRTINDLRSDCAKALISCFYDQKKTKSWLDSISKLGSDENFASMRLEQLESEYRALHDCALAEKEQPGDVLQNIFMDNVVRFLSRMSSGHAIVLLIITRLVAVVEEKTLVLLDEPESHLHPPLLSAFVRALSDLLYDRNGVAIIATHSPVVLQEIPRSCVWKLYRVGESVKSSRPSIETFGENVGVLTSEVFSLEVERSGFHYLLAASVETGNSYEEIVDEYNGQLGFEARAILKALIANRNRKNHDSVE